jgi:limonene-1,2-epoxide hydrolase
LLAQMLQDDPMRRALIFAMIVLVMAPAASATRGPAAVARAWSAAINRGDNEAAANLFASNAVVAQSGYVLHLKTHRLAVEWNAGLPCAGRILKITVRKDVADATFVLGHRPGKRCDGPGQKARAAFKVRNGKIVLWIQLPVVEPQKGTTTGPPTA